MTSEDPGAPVASTASKRKSAKKTARPAPGNGAAKKASQARPPRKAAAPATSQLRAAEIVLINGMRLAVALSYAPGSTPYVVACARGAAAEDIVWAAEELRIPVVEMAALNPDDAAVLKPGDEIPEALYRPVAHALALLYRAAPSPTLVRFLRVVGLEGKRREARLKALDAEYGDLMAIAPVHVEVGEMLMEFSGEFLDPLHQVRQKVAIETGLMLPAVPIRGNPHLGPSSFRVYLHDVPLQEGEVDLPIDSPEKLYIIANRVKQIVYRHGWELLGYQEVESHVELVRRKHPGLVKALFPTAFSMSALRQVLRNLLRESLSIRDLATILEVILENLSTSHDPDLLTECVRMAYSRSLCNKYQDAEGFLNVLVLHPDVERTLAEALREAGGTRWLDLGVDEGLRVLRALEAGLRNASALQFSPVLLSSPMLRRFISRLIEPIFPDLPVMSYNEIAPLSQVRSIGSIAF
ncbi:MAG: hypothetical protein FJX76_22120 [Armatimonadetes bacterium]|nr:hypothetical protein [Armatimonadota bacterium]